MKRILIMAGISCLLAGCNSKPSDFELATQALYNRDTNALAAIVARNKGVSAIVSRFDGATLLHHSMANTPDIAAAEMLIQAGADVNQCDVTGATPLHIACRHGAKPEAISFLIKHGADVNMRDGEGLTPLQIALRPGFGRSDEGIALLKQAGAKE